MKKFFQSVLLFLLFVVLIISFIVGYIWFRYTNWEKLFESNINSNYLITSETTRNLETKITKFALSSSDTEFLELSVDEVGSVLFDVMDSYLGEDITLLNMYIEPSNGRWIVGSKVKYKEISFWVSFDINKDEMQTAQLYTTNIFLGPYSVHSYTNWVSIINKGIGEAIVTLNENGFVGRYIENIELLESSLVLKGARY